MLSFPVLAENITSAHLSGRYMMAQCYEAYGPFTEYQFSLGSQVTLNIYQNNPAPIL